LALWGRVENLNSREVEGGVDSWEHSSRFASLAAPEGSLNAISGILESCTWGTPVLRISERNKKREREKAPCCRIV
jgi:hypothetical protein